MGYRFSVQAPEAHPWVHLVFTVLVLVAIAAGVVLIIRSWRHPLPPPPAGAWGAPSPAVHELDMRYARGEVDRAEYMQRRADILGHGGVPPAPSGPDTPPS